MKEYEQHPLSAAFPGMSTEQHEALIQDIEAVGLRDPITLYEGMVLDGWHRYQAGLKLGLQEVRFVEYEGFDPAGFVLSKNLQRRHLDPSQRAFAVAQLFDWQEKAGRPSKAVLIARDYGNFSALSAADTAKQICVSDKTVLQARAATRAIPEIQQAVQDGNMSVAEASRLAKQSPEEQLVALNNEASRPKRKRETIALADYQQLKEDYDNLMMNYEAMATELSACDAVINSKEVAEMKKLHLEINTLRASRDQWMKKSSELTRQLNYAENKLKKYKMPDLSSR